MDFTLGLVTGMYAVIAVIVFYVVYVIEVKLDLPAIVNGHSNNNNNNSNSNHNNNNNGSTCNINGNNEQNDDSSQTRLRTLIETIIAETLRNSALGFNTGASASVSEISLDTRTQSELNALKQRHRTEHYFEPKIYQDLLATAVLNKIADTEGNNRRRSLISESTPDLSGHNNIDENYNAEALSTTSGSSIEPRSDCSLTDNELVLNTGKTDSPLSLQAAFERESVLSDYIAAHMVPLPDFSASVTESEDDNGSVTSSMIADGTWEDNWLFKKKQHSSLQSSATPSSIGMLVPAPRENVRAQIGDRTADEVSDLSEMGSDVEETSLDINDRLLNKHLIGGQNTKLVLDELIDRTSLISHTLPEEHEPAFTEATNPLILQTQPTEVPSQFVEPPPPTTFQDDQHIEEPILIAGSIAEREVKKWYNAVEMPNNPYAPEALKQRISGTQERCMDVPNISPSAEQKALALKANAEDATDRQPQSHQTDYKRYSRDYYINNNNNGTTVATGEKIDVARSGPEDVDIVINEVNAPNAQPPIQPPHGRNSVSAQSTRNVDAAAAAATVSGAADLSHWTLSTPVRRSSSLKFINTNNNNNKRTSPPTTISNFNAHHHVVRRPSTSASHYCDTSLDDIDDFDVHSQRSWRSLRPARSTLSLQSNGSGMSFGSSVSKRSRAGPTTSVLTQFEKQLLHKDLKRNSFRAVSATSKDFVMNPLFEGEARATSAKLTLRPETTLDEQGDSGVDSCLNGFSGTDTQYSNNSLLF
ncbi:uncharacterized protein Dwil_GK10681, isoform C [Drosophila willistoni]|uniref:Uncharacterized protein, isoform C n=1 Tax=Drosophila willistoni TaxID=7260 RepID=A0A0Q9WVP1_DROWI|nr:probable serine/threonine-protein kinase DDB_G0282963 isoform X11 [Drosophila willistoni]KRF97444.1 uncharacterized protein Dwil_GK10681, isoform C [Drosophila willistoni]